MKKTKKILIINPTSTRVNYIKDIRDAGYIPVVFVLPERKDTCNCGLFGDKLPTIYKLDNNYSKTLALAKKINPIFILTGNDYALELTLRLSKDLKLVATAYENFQTMHNKYLQQEALRKSRVRYIHTKTITTTSDAKKYYKTLKNKKVVAKPVCGSSTVGVHICKNEKEFNIAINDIIAKRKLKAIIQEYIGGEEYVVNSVSYNGIHKITSIWSYKKRVIPGYGPIYERLDFLSPKLKLSQKLIKYNLKVLKALHITYGAMHNEIKLDKKGPVLIEANCRVGGGSMPAKYLDKILGHHETDIVVKSYLNPKWFYKLPNEIIPIGHGIIKFLILKHDIKVSKIKFPQVFSKLPSFFTCNAGINGNVNQREVKYLKKTIDYETSPGNIFMVNKNLKQLNADYNKIVDMENNHLEKLFDYKEI